MKADGSESTGVLSPRGRGDPFSAQNPGRASNSLAMSEERRSELELLHEHRQRPGQSTLAKRQRDRMMVGGEANTKGKHTRKALAADQGSASGKVFRNGAL